MSSGFHAEGRSAISLVAVVVKQNVSVRELVRVMAIVELVLIILKGEVGSNFGRENPLLFKGGVVEGDDGR